jgi:hypothetical protein
MGTPTGLGDGRPGDKKRADEIKGPATPPPTASGGFDVRGELRELLALPLADGDLAVAAAELGMEVQPQDPYSVSGRLARLADEVSAGR